MRGAISSRASKSDSVEIEIWSCERIVRSFNLSSYARRNQVSENDLWKKNKEKEGKEAASAANCLPGGSTVKVKFYENFNQSFLFFWFYTHKNHPAINWNYRTIFLSIFCVEIYNVVILLLQHVKRVMENWKWLFTQQFFWLQVN